jgi:hypothetical protein
VIQAERDRIRGVWLAQARDSMAAVVVVSPNRLPACLSGTQRGVFSFAATAAAGFASVWPWPPSVVAAATAGVSRREVCGGRMQTGCVTIRVSVTVLTLARHRFDAWTSHLASLPALLGAAQILLRFDAAVRASPA